MTNKNKNSTKTIPIRLLDERQIQYEVRMQSSKQHTAEGVAKDLDVPVAQVVKAMLVQRSSNLSEGSGLFALIVIPGDSRLSLKKVGIALADKKVQLASQRDVLRVTGYQVGAVSVLGFRRDDVSGFVDQRVLGLNQVIISAGRPDIGLALNPSEFIRAMEGFQAGDYCED